MIIDAHGHIGCWEGNDLTPEYLLGLMEGSQIDLALISSIDGVGRDTRQDAANESVYQVVCARPDKFRGLVWVNPWYQEEALADVQRRLEQGGKFVGLKFHPYHNDFDFDDEIVHPFLRLAQFYQVPVAVHTAYDSHSLPERVVRVAEQKEFQRVNFILYHAGLGPPDRQAGEDVLYQVSVRPNLYIDASWVSLERLQLAFRMIPAERILFGTDLPLGQQHHYQEYFERFAQLDLDPQTWSLFFEGSARQLFNL